MNALGWIMPYDNMAILNKSIVVNIKIGLIRVSSLSSRLSVY
jgi:hypothetical protein